MKAIGILIVALFLTGCGGMGKVISVYGDSAVSRSEIDFEDHTYRIFDRKDLNSVMITPSFGDSAKGGLIKGATFGGLNIQDDRERFTKVAQAYLEQERKNELCIVKGGEIILDPQWEFTYSCVAKK